jgi:hypothetical protein
VTGAHRQLLGNLGATVLRPFDGAAAGAAVGRPSGTVHQGNDDAARPAGQASMAIAAASVLGAIMDVEHRAVQARLESLWVVLWTCASSGSGKQGSPAMPDCASSRFIIMMTDNPDCLTMR